MHILGLKQKGDPRRVPIGPTEVDWGHPLANGLRVAYTPAWSPEQGSRNLGYSHGPDGIGPVHTFPGDSSYLYINMKTGVPEEGPGLYRSWGGVTCRARMSEKNLSWTEYSLSCRVWMGNLTSNNSDFLWSKNSGVRAGTSAAYDWGIYLSGGDVLYFYPKNNSNVNSSVTITSLRTPISVAGTYRSGSSAARIYTDGVLRATSGTITGSTGRTNNFLYPLGGFAGNQPVSGMLDGKVWDRKLSDDEVAWDAAEPYVIYRQQRARVLFLPPTVAGNITVDLAALEASAISDGTSPGVVLGDLSIAPASSDSISTATDPTVVQGSLAIDLSTLSADAVSSATAPTVVEGNIIIDLSALEAVGISSATDPIVVQSSVIIDLDALSADSVSSATDPIVIQGTLSITPASADAVSSATDPTVTISAVVLDLSGDPASAVSGATDSVVVQGTIVLDLVALEAAAVSSASIGAVVLGSMSITPASADVVSSATNPTVTEGSGDVSVDLSSDVASAISSASIGAVVLGSISISNLSASATVTASDPSVALSGINITPSSADVTSSASIGAVVDPNDPVSDERNSSSLMQVRGNAGKRTGR